MPPLPTSSATASPAGPQRPQTSSQARTLLTLLSSGILLVLSACTVIPPDPDRPTSHAIQAPSSSPLVKVAQQAQRRTTQNQSQFLLVNNAREALMWRLALIDSATTSIDFQTFLWGNDSSGSLLFDRLLKAAQRGVRIRLLVDDIWLSANEQDLATICRHPSVNIRLFNPSRVRNSKFGQAVYFLSNYRKMNQRMHNKTFIADGVIAIHGGRNVGDHYFGLDKTYNFRDLDVISTGPVLSEIKHEFDSFWNSPEAYPAENLAKSRSVEYITGKARQLSSKVKGKKSTILASYPTQPQSWNKRLNALPNRMTPGKAKFVSDAPNNDQQEQRILVGELGKMIAKAKKEIIIVSPYFIPHKSSFEDLKKFTAQGVKVHIIVPSMGANNHTPAHSHYRKYRRQLLQAGARLYEFNFQPSAQQRELCDVPPVQADWIGLHLKTIIVDRQHCYIGTLNLDPRAMRINTEEGLIIHSKALGKELTSHVQELIEPANAWELKLNPYDRIRWHGMSTKPLRRQPARGAMQRITDAIARWIPIEHEL